MKTIPYDVYFKGFFAFAVWGYIPPPGGDEFQSLFIKTVLDKKAVDKMPGLGRAAAKEEEQKEDNFDCWLDTRGITSPNKSHSHPLASSNQLINDLMAKGRMEEQRQKTYRVKVDRLEFQMQFQTDRMSEVKDKLRLLDSDKESEKRRLKVEWKEITKEKQNLYEEWKKVTSMEESNFNGRRT